jgi:hypothetical protein
MYLQKAFDQAQACYICEGKIHMNLVIKVDFESNKFKGLSFLRQILPFLQR